MTRWLFAYHSWARRRILVPVRTLTADEPRRPAVIPGGHGDGSLFATLVHLIDVEESWLARWLGEEIPAELDHARYSDLARAVSIWEEVDRRRDAFLAGLGDADLERVLRRGRRPQGEEVVERLWVTMLHVSNHTTHHRAELCTALTALGHPPGQMELVKFALDPDDLGVTAIA
jgi:uncharacterized damage-inducible protein DinB